MSGQHPDPATGLSQSRRILLLLEAAGGEGVPNGVLGRTIGLRYSARILELRRDGWPIVSVHGRGSSWRYVLTGKREAAA